MEVIEDLSGMREQGAAGIRQADPAAVALDQFPSSLVLEGGYSFC